jgi:hypothetical protein
MNRFVTVDIALGAFIAGLLAVDPARSFVKRHRDRVLIVLIVVIVVLAVIEAARRL